MDQRKLQRTAVKKTFCTTREAAALLGVSLRTAQLWAEGGLLAGWKTKGGHRRIDRTSVERLLVSVAALPADGLPVAVAGTTGAAAAEKGEFRILVAEDDPVLRSLYEINLGEWPMAPKVTLVSDGYEALLRIGRERPDLLIADLQMPQMDGFFMLEAIRKVEELAGMAIVVVTGLGAQEIAARGGIPADIPILFKPVSFDALEAIAERTQRGHSRLCAVVE